MVAQTKPTPLRSPQRPREPAARARALMKTPEEWMARAIELAWNEHTIGTLRYIHTNGEGSHFYYAQSRSKPELPHMVVINPTRQYFSCDCIAAAYSNPCPHIGAAWHAFEQMVAASVQRNMANQRQYEWWSYYSQSGADSEYPSGEMNAV